MSGSRAAGAAISLALVISSCTGEGRPVVSSSPSPTPVPTGISIHVFRAKVGELCRDLEADYPRFGESVNRKRYVRKLERATKVTRSFVRRLRTVPEPEGYEGTYEEYVKVSDVFLAQIRKVRRFVKNREKVLKLIVKIMRNELRHFRVGDAAGLPDICIGLTSAEIYQDLFAAKANVMCERHFDDVEEISDGLDAASSNSTIRDLYGRLYTVEQTAIKQIPRFATEQVPQRQIKKLLGLYRDTSATVARMRDAFAALSQSAYDAAFADFKETRKKAIKFGDRLDLYVCNGLF